jgi:ribosomal protein S8E
MDGDWTTLNASMWLCLVNKSQYSLYSYSDRRKRIARESHRLSATSQKIFGLKAKILHKKRHAEKVQLKKTLKAHDERHIKQSAPSSAPDGALPTYLLDREGQRDAKALSTALKQKRKDKAAKYAVPLPKVRGIAEEEMFKVMRTGKNKSKSWKRMVTKATFVGEGFTRKPVKMERFVRPMALRYKRANVTHRTYIFFSLSKTIRFLTRWISGPKSDIPACYSWCKEEPAIANVYAIRSDYKRNGH